MREAFFGCGAMHRLLGVLSSDPRARQIEDAERYAMRVAEHRAGLGRGGAGRFGEGVFGGLHAIARGFDDAEKAEEARFEEAMAEIWTNYLWPLVVIAAQSVLLLVVLLIIVAYILAENKLIF